MCLTLHLHLPLLLYKIGPPLVSEWEHIDKKTITLLLCFYLSSLFRPPTCIGYWKRRPPNTPSGDVLAWVGGWSSFWVAHRCDYSLVGHTPISGVQVQGNNDRLIPLLYSALLFTTSLSTSKWQWPCVIGIAIFLHYIEWDDYINKLLCLVMEMALVSLAHLCNYSLHVSYF